MKHTIIVILASLFLASCSQNPEQKEEKVTLLNSSTPESVVKDYWNAWNNKDLDKIGSILYYKIYDRFEEKEVKSSFLQILNAGDVTALDVSYDGATIHLDSISNGNVLSQKYNIKTQFIVKETSDDEFEKMKGFYMNQDPNAEISDENKSIIFTSKKKQFIVSDDRGTFIIPDMYFAELNLDSLGLAGGIKNYMAIP